jgi:hypothetical protein
MRHRILIPAILLLAFVPASIPALASTQPNAIVAPSSAGKNCGKFNGTVILTYTNPTTIILHIIQGKVNAPTTFTMTPTTTYLRNGQPARFADIKLGDTGTITATEQLPSGTLLACSVIMTGP